MGKWKKLKSWIGRRFCIGNIPDDEYCEKWDSQSGNPENRNMDRQPSTGGCVGDKAPFCAHGDLLAKFPAETWINWVPPMCFCSNEANGFTREVNLCSICSWAVASAFEEEPSEIEGKLIGAGLVEMTVVGSTVSVRDVPMREDENLGKKLGSYTGPIKPILKKTSRGLDDLDALLNELYSDSDRQLVQAGSTATCSREGNYITGYGNWSNQQKSAEVLREHEVLRQRQARRPAGVILSDDWHPHIGVGTEYRPVVDMSRGIIKGGGCQGNDVWPWQEQSLDHLWKSADKADRLAGIYVDNKKHVRFMVDEVNEHKARGERSENMNDTEGDSYHVEISGLDEDWVQYPVEAMPPSQMEEVEDDQGRILTTMKLEWNSDTVVGNAVRV